MTRKRTDRDESPCSPVVTFQSFGSEGHGIQPPKGDSFSLYLFSTLLLCFLDNRLFLSYKPSHVSVFKKGHRACLIVKYIYLNFVLFIPSLFS